MRESGPIKNKHDQPSEDKCCTVPTVRVRLIQDVRVLPNECVTAQVRLEGEMATTKQQPFLVETDPDVSKQTKMQVFDAVLHAAEDGTAQLSLLNQLGACQKIMKGTDIGKATPVDVLDERSTQAVDVTPSIVSVITDTTAADEADRKLKLKEYLESGGVTGGMTIDEQCEILSLLERCHDVFSLTEGERGETDLVEMLIDTGDAVPRKQAARRIPFAARQEVTKH